MGSIRITADDYMIEQARQYAARRKTSLNALVCDWLTNLLPQKKEAESCLTPELIPALDAAKGNSRGQKWTRDSCWSQELEAAIEAAQGNSRGQKWTREELYRV